MFKQKTKKVISVNLQTNDLTLLRYALPDTSEMPSFEEVISQELTDNKTCKFNKEGLISANKIIKFGDLNLRFNSPVMILNKADGQYLYPIKKVREPERGSQWVLGEGAFGDVYLAEDNYFRINDGKFEQKNNNPRPVLKIIDLNRKLDKWLYKTPLAVFFITNPIVSLIFSVIALVAQRKNLDNETEMGNRYFSARAGDTGEKLVKTEYQQTLPHSTRSKQIVVMEQPNMKGIHLAEFLGIESEMKKNDLGYKAAKADTLAEYSRNSRWIANDENKGKLTFGTRMQLAKALIEQMDVMNKAGMVHGDLFLDNIQVLDEKQVDETLDIALLDFTFARDTSADKKIKLHKTWLAFDPPEIKTEFHKVDAKAAETYTLAINLQCIFGYTNDVLKATGSNDRLKQLISMMKNDTPAERPTFDKVKEEFASIYKQSLQEDLDKPQVLNDNPSVRFH